ncbi:hypothetical protein IAR55_001464 [Kwoniella newhampshirensis]|uniref:DUF974 domain-containing protein n=1 Tax=Kwoniella newhampshirensis TaxID=1651941 RepID=A0AAW0Z291_9TREE
MDTAPLTLNVLAISPRTLIPTSLPPSYAPLPTEPLPTPPPPDGFTFSPTPNYPTPYGSLSLGSTLSLKVGLENTHPRKHGVLGVKMMIEVQGPGGRYRLGEVVHQTNIDVEAKSPDRTGAGDPLKEAVGAGEEGTPPLPELKPGEMVEIQVESEMKDLGLNVIICSVAWETLDGRRTFQRFLRFNVQPPLAIKTRIQTPSHPNHTLSPQHREDIYLEILMQNISIEGMILQSVNLESVQGLISRPIITSKKEETEKETLIPNDTRQYLFVLSPDPSYTTSSSAIASASSSKRSRFPPTYPGGTILPLGRLDVTWIAGPFHTPGRLQTSTLNRRVPLVASDSHPQRSRPNRNETKTIPPSPLGTPARQTTVSPSPRAGGLPRVDQEENDDGENWEFDLTMEGEREVDIEQTFEMSFHLSVRSSSAAGEGASTPPAAPKLAIQYLTPVPPVPPAVPPIQPLNGAAPTLALSLPSRISTPLSPGPSVSASGRPYSPLTPSRPMTPLSTQLRQAAGSLISGGSVPSTPQGGVAIWNPGLGQEQSLDQQIVFPPPPTVVQSPIPNQHKPLPSISPLNPSTSIITNPKKDATTTTMTTMTNNQIIHIGNSLLIFSPDQFVLEPKLINTGPSYTPTEGEDGQVNNEGSQRWEGEYEFCLKFMGWDEGLASLGGLRVLVLDSQDEEGEGLTGGIGREWESLGDVLVLG